MPGAVLNLSFAMTQFSQVFVEGLAAVSILQMRRLSFREVWQIAQSHPAQKELSQCLKVNSASLAHPEDCRSSSLCLLGA